MDWLTKITSTGLQAASSGLQAAQRAASDFVPADAAERARALAQEAGRYAQEASLKAQVRAVRGARGSGRDLRDRPLLISAALPVLTRCAAGHAASNPQHLR
jgi:hypothetical protein